MLVEDSTGKSGSKKYQVMTPMAEQPKEDMGVRLGITGHGGWSVFRANSDDKFNKSAIAYLGTPPKTQAARLRGHDQQ